MVSPLHWGGVYGHHLGVETATLCLGQSVLDVISLLSDDARALGQAPDGGGRHLAVSHAQNESGSERVVFHTPL